MKADLSPTGRALRALELLQAQPGITAGQLAAQLDVTERAARRYIAILREADIPVESTRGPYGGYRLGRGIRLPPLVFTAVEVCLWVALSRSLAQPHNWNIAFYTLLLLLILLRPAGLFGRVREVRALESILPHWLVTWSARSRA